MHRPVPTKERKAVISNFPKQKQALDTENCTSEPYQIFKEQYSLAFVWLLDVCGVDVCGVPACTQKDETGRDC